MPANKDYEHVLWHQLVTWMVCFGSITALAVAGWVVPHLWLPLVGVGLIMCVSFYDNHSRNSTGCHCSMLGKYTIYTLFLSVVLMLAINLANTRWIDSSVLGGGNPMLPFVSTMVVFACSPVMYGVAMLRKHKGAGCDSCRHNMGYTIGEVMERNLFHREASSLLRLAFFISLTLGVAEALYCRFFYINVNINSPDAFMFFIVPSIAYALSIFYLAQKYSSMKFEINMSGEAGKNRFNTMLRFIVIREDRVLLEMEPVDGQDFGLWDTPAVIEMPYTENIDDGKAIEMLRKQAGNLDMQVRRLFSTSNNMHHVLHFAVVLHRDSTVNSKILENNSFLRGEWFNVYEISSMQRSGMVSRPFSYEIHRIYTMTMAWKTYDLQGKRLYPIKNYKPTFRLDDFLEWNVDYNDKRWMQIAENNEDKPFFWLRKFWRRHVSRIE